MSFRYPLCPAVSFSQEIQTLAAEADALGLQKVLLLTGETVGQQPFFATIRETLGDRVAFVWDKVPPLASVAAVRTVAAQLVQGECDGLISVGGGSTIDTAKAALLTAGEERDPAEIRVRFTPPDKVEVPRLKGPRVPHICLPTTTSGAESNYSAAVKETELGVKWVFQHPRLAPDLIFLWPEVMTALPAAFTAGSGLNAIAHCIEALYANQRNVLADALALGALPLLWEALPRAVADSHDLEAMGMLMQASAMAGMALASARACVHHAMCHVLGSRSGVPHPVANGICLPYAMRFNLNHSGQAYSRAMQALGLSGKPESLISEISRFCAELGLPTRLREAGVKQEHLTLLAADALNDRCIANNPRPILRTDELYDLFESAW